MTTKKRNWSELCQAYHFDNRIKWRYISDGLYDIRGCAIIDVDNTLTRGRTLTQNWLSSLYRHPKIAKVSSKINEALADFQQNPWNVKATFDKIFLNILKKVPLREDVYIDACLDAATTTAPPPRTRELMFDLRDRGITRGVMTYGVEGTLIPWYNYRISVPAYLRGIRLIFRNGYLVDYDMGGPYGKASFAPFFIKILNYMPDQVFTIDDDPIIDNTLVAMLGIGFAIWLDKDEKRKKLVSEGLYKYPGKTPIVIDGVENNMQLIVKYVDKWKRARFISETKTPKEIYHLNKEFEKMKLYLKLCKEDEKHLRMNMRNFIESCERIVNMGNPFVATILSGVDDLFSELRSDFHRGVESKELLTIADELCSLLENQNPEFRLTGDYLEEMLYISS